MIDFVTVAAVILGWELGKALVRFIRKHPGA
jgi:hypothetical protein